jgi:hypothetical protein
MIDAYRFGEMVINGKRYRSDLLIFPDGIVADGWRRQEGHRLSLQDVGRLLTCGARTIVAGTGSSGRMIPHPSLAEELQARGIDFICAPCTEAVATYNHLLEKGRPVAGCFHLTC